MTLMTLTLGLTALLGAALMAPLGVVGLRDRGTQRGSTFAALMFCLSAWAAGAGLDLIVRGGKAGLIDILVFIGMAAGPVLWLQLSLSFAERAAWLTRRRTILLWAIAVLFLTVTTIYLVDFLIGGGPWPAAAMGYLPDSLGLAYGVYATILGVSGAAVLLLYALRSGHLRRAQALILLAAAAIPLLAGAANIIVAGPRVGIQLTPQAFLFSALILWFGVIRFYLISASPLVHRVLFEKQNDAALVVDARDNLVEANPAAMSLFALADTDLAKPFTAAITWPEMHGDRTHAAISVFVREEPGGRQWYEMRVEPLPPSRGSRHGRLILVRNVSDLRRSQQQLEESEAFYRNVVEQQEEGIALLNADDVFTYANPAAERIFGTGQGMLCGRSIHEFLPSEQTAFSEASAHGPGAPATHEIEIVREDGAQRTLFMTTARQHSEPRHGSFLIFRDLTASRQADRLSQQWRQRYEMISAMSGQLVYFHDAATNNVEWGESVHQVLGYSRDELTGGIVQWANMMHPADRQHVLARMAAAEKVYEDDYRLQHKLGHYLLVHAHVMPVHDAQGATAGYLSVLRDISRQHRLQQSVLRHTERLERLHLLSLSLSTQSDPNSLAHAVVRGAVNLLHATAAVLYTVDPLAHTLRRVAAEPERMAQALDLHPAYVLAQMVVMTKQRQQTTVDTDEPQLAGTALEHLARAARIAVPLTTGSELGAVLVVEDTQRTAFDAEDEKLIWLLANQAAAELTNSRLLLEAKNRAQRLQIVSEITTSVIQALDLPVVLQHVVDGLARVLGVDSTRIALFDEAHQRMTVIAHHALEDATRTPLQTGADIGAELLRLVLHVRRPLYIDNAATDPRTEDMRDQLERHGIASLLVIPVMAGEEVLGVIVADFVDNSPPLSKEDMRIGETLANLAAVRIQQVRLYNTLERLSIVDELTQVYNYRALFEIGENEFARSLRYRRPLSAVFIDIDNFRQFNNRYSHAVGNQVLRAVGRRLLAITRTVDFVARFGGEEFVVLLPETDLPMATTVAYRVHQEIAKLQVVTDHGPLGVTVSVGVATRSDSMQSLQDLLDLANKGEHNAKEEGRNRVVVC